MENERKPPLLLRQSEADTRFFPFGNQKSRMLYRALYPYVFISNPDAYDYTKNLAARNNSGYTMIRVKVADSMLTSAALPCIEYKNSFWYITGGYNNEIFFVAEQISKGTDDPLIHLTGILEPFPQFHMHHRKAVKRLETEFSKGQLSIGKYKEGFTIQLEAQKRGPRVRAFSTNNDSSVPTKKFFMFIVRIQKRIKLCKLDAFNKFRLCSVVGAAWLHQRRQRLIFRRWFMQKELADSGSCVEGVKISLGSSSSQEFSQPVDLLTAMCGIQFDAVSCSGRAHAERGFLSADEDSGRRSRICSGIARARYRNAGSCSLLKFASRRFLGELMRFEPTQT